MARAFVFGDVVRRRGDAGLFMGKCVSRVVLLRVVLVVWGLPLGVREPKVLARLRELSQGRWHCWNTRSTAASRTSADQRGLVDLLEGTDFDVACLQEVVPELRDRLAASERVREDCEVVAGHRIDEGYGVLILSRLPVHRGWELSLPSVMGRSVLGIELSTDLGRVAVATVHLESTRAMAGSRAEQLAMAFEASTGTRARPLSATSTSTRLTRRRRRWIRRTPTCGRCCGRTTRGTPRTPRATRCDSPIGEAGGTSTYATIASSFVRPAFDLPRWTCSQRIPLERSYSSPITSASLRASTVVPQRRHVGDGREHRALAPELDPAEVVVILVVKASTGATT